MKLRQLFTFASYSLPAIAAAACAAITWTTINHHIFQHDPVSAVVISATATPDNTGLGAFVVVASCALVPVGIFLALFLYFLPWFVATRRNHRNEAAILIVNLLLGWSLLGWVAALVWALYRERPPIAANYPLEA
jgi:hypothetical protein